MNSKILENVKSPFSDELIHNLIKEYLSCNCDDNLFYNKINNLEASTTKVSPFTQELVKHIQAKGKYIYDINPSQPSPPFFYKDNNSWLTLYSEQDPMKDNQRNPNNKIPLLYRIYLNLKDKEKSDFVLNYIDNCQKNNLPYKFKISKEEFRNDQIVLLSRFENLEKNISIIEEITQHQQLGDLPMLIGSYKDKIGIAEEFYNRLYSPTKAKLTLVRSSVKKYLCDYKNEFYPNLSEVDKKQLDKYIKDFEDLYNNQLEDQEYLGEDYEDLNKKYYQNKSSIDCAKEHIENDSNAYISGNGLSELSNAIQQIYANNPQKFIHEVTQNYKLISTQVWGFSQDFVFSNETKEKLATLSKKNAVQREMI